jgi:hypothetical protein
MVRAFGEEGRGDRIEREESGGEQGCGRERLA